MQRYLKHISAALLRREPARFKQWRLYLYQALLDRVSRQQTIKELIQLNLERRYRVNIGRPTKINLLLVGCGGSGSYAAHILAQFGVWAAAEGLDVRLLFIDPDTVEPKNLVRQNFCQAEVGYPKAFSLAWRYTAAFGLKITPVVARFSAQILAEHSPRYGSDNALTVVIGAVDNVQARRDIAAAVTRQLELRRAIWWIDAGNERDAGQVLAGSSLEPEPLLSPLGYCTALPLPHIQEPSLLQSRPRPQTDGVAPSAVEGPAPSAVEGPALSPAEGPALSPAEGPALSPAEGPALSRVEGSCAELGLLAEQSAMINRQMATWIGVYLYRLLQSRDLDMMATWIDLAGGGVRSTPITGGRRLKPDKPARIPVQQVDADVPQPVPVNPDTPTELICPQCDEAQLVDGHNDYYGATIAVRFCDQCTYRVEGCPECWGDLEESSRRDEYGHPVPVIRCTECGWQHDLNAERTQIGADDEP